MEIIPAEIVTKDRSCKKREKAEHTEKLRFTSVNQTNFFPSV
jgi:hypothetical protein